VTGPIYALLAFTTAIFISAASASRWYSIDGRTFIVVIAMVLYVIGNLLMIPIMRAAGMGVALSISTIAQLILANVAAFVIFHERPAPMQVAGLVLGLIGMALIMLPTGER
jgi:small multidrug resistance pump